MRYILGAFIVIGLVILLNYSDFFLSRYIRDRIDSINTQALRSYSYRPISRLNILTVSLLFWIPPFYLLCEKLFLEYKIIITVLYWAAVSSVLALYMKGRSSKETVRKALPFIIICAVAAGLILGPILTAMTSFFGL